MAKSTPADSPPVAADNEPIDVNAELEKVQGRRILGRETQQKKDRRKCHSASLDPHSLQPLGPKDWSEAKLDPPTDATWQEGHGPRTTALEWNGNLRDGITPRLKKGEKKGPFVRKLADKGTIEFGELYDEGPGVFVVRLAGFHELTIPDPEGARGAVDRFNKVMSLRAVDMSVPYEVICLSGDGGGGVG